ncbi:hypothetical protein LI328DRAFT_162313 [Trichoderma asperelloides]|nr:hypothetical protein LI328DRAFT_162313 [Trichoderma asperelloides]
MEAQMIRCSICRFGHHRFPKCEKKPVQSIVLGPGSSRENMEGDPSHTHRLTDIYLQKTSDEYTAGWICAICTEYIAAQAALDEKHERPSHVAPADQNDYTFGRIGNHNVVIAVLPDGEYGVESAAIVARDMMHSFANIKLGLMVGVGGGAPSERNDIRLGDIVVGVPRDGQSGVLQYGFGKMVQGQPFQATRLLNQSPRILRAAVNGLQSQYRLKGYRQLRDIIDDVLERNPTLQTDFGRPSLDSDRLYRSEIMHPKDSTLDCSVSCGDDPSKLVVRPRRIADEGAPVVHCGLIASSNTLMKDAMTRDEYALKKNVMCFEMEAAGLMNQFPCLVIRGISDYSDTHKNKNWQGYAAIAAAAYAKDLLRRIALDNTNIPQRVAGEENTQTPSDNQKQALLKSLKFDNYNKRYDNIQAAHAETCKWLQESAEYITWLDPNKINDHHGFLCIRGKPGAGKSTIMKYALVTARETMGDRILLSFFFNARGGDLEKSTLGMYRSLLLQLLEQLPALLDSLDLSKFTACHDEGYRWHIEPLKSLFRQAIENIQTSKVVCFIDALNECDDDQARDTLSFFEYLAGLATSKGISFLLTIVLETRIHQDIHKYVRSELKIGQSDIANPIRANLAKRSWGLFMWEYDMGRIYNLHTRYLELPGDLRELFKDILARNSDRKSIETLRCFQWLLFSRELLRPEQVAPSQISKPDMLRFILNSSLGLAEIGTSSGSMGDFLLGEDGLKEIWPDQGDNIPGRSHEYLKECCLKCIKIGSFYASQSLKQTNYTSETIASIQLWASDSFPILGYAVGNVLYHANEAQKYGISQAEFLKEFKLGPWVILRSIFEVWAHSPNTRLLYTLAELNTSYLIGCHPSKLAFSEVGDEYFGTPLFAALANGTQAEIIPEFRNLYEEYCRKSLDLSHFRQDFIFSRFKNILSHFTHPDEGNKILQDVAIQLIKAGAKIEARDGQDYTPLMLAVTEGRKNMAMDDNGMTPLMLAMENHRTDLVTQLLEKGCNFETRDAKGMTPLMYAVRLGSRNVVRLLLEKGASMEATDKSGKTLLIWAVISGHKDLVIRLLEKGSDIEARDKAGQTPLMWAIRKRNQALIREKIMAKRELTLLEFAQQFEETEIIELISRNGAT